ncbi:hypothetical protein B0J17DRAFT_585649 [Rhizoctonia solani]|nr:hypothetical protein B0J17DRAFT_585649 [Rhizoctonia solani]
MKVWTQLAAKEKKGQEKSGQLLGNGLPAVLTSDNFHAQVVEQGKAAQEEQARKEAIANAKREHRERIAKWKTVDQMRIKQNKERLEEWRASHEAWKVEQDLTKIEKREPGWQKPCKPKPQKASPKPTLMLPCFLSNSEDESNKE